MAVLVPNVRGSSGYGKTYLSLDNGFKREDSVKDIGALLDWIAKQPELDAQRVGVSGGSYGGYMVLATLIHYSDRIRAGVDVVGISHFGTFLKNTESYRRDLRRVEYGDERDPEMNALSERIAPLNNASKITAPLFVAQGRNDPRVPWTEAEQIVKAVRGNGERRSGTCCMQGRRPRLRQEGQQRLVRRRHHAVLAAAFAQRLRVWPGELTGAAIRYATRNVAARIAAPANSPHWSACSRDSSSRLRSTPQR